MMEKSEPTLVPEWLRCPGSVTGSGTSANHIASSSLYTDLSSSTRDRSFRSISDKDCKRSVFVDQTSSSNSRRNSSSNGSIRHPYSSFTRSHRDRNRDKEKERPVVRGPCDHDTSDPLGSLLTSRTDKLTLRRSQSLVSRKPGEVLPHRAEGARNGVSSGGSNVIGTQKAVFEKDFPSLGTECKQAASCITRVPSPGLSSAAQSFPIGSSPLLGSEKWTSALAEVPAMVNGMSNSSAQQNVVATPKSAASSSLTGLNMAEALAQAPPRARAAPQVPDKTQRLEELAIKQSRQLIPMVPYSSDKSKQQLKPAGRTCELILAPKNVQQQAYANQSRSGQVKSDASNASHLGKFLVLKPARENGVASAKDASTQTSNSSGQVSDSQVSMAPLTPTALTSSPKVSALESKTAVLSLTSRANTEKRHSPSKSQSRSDFFKLMRKKSLNNTSNVLPASSPVSSPKLKNYGEDVKESDTFCLSSQVSDSDSQVTSNGKLHDTPEKVKSFPDEGDKNLYLNGTFYPDEEEAAFLRSLGWEESAGEDEGLTEEEINAFYEEYMKSRPSLKVWRGSHPKILLSELRTSNSGDASESSSSGSGYET